MFIEIFGGFFTSIFNILMAIIFCLIGIIFGVIIYRVLTRPKNQIIYFRERDKRAVEMDIAKEDAITLETNTNPPLRFYKYGGSYELRKRGRAFTRFLAKEGTAYTWTLQGFRKVKKKIKDAKGKTQTKFETVLKQVSVPFSSVEDLIKSLWSEEFYATVPEEQQSKLRENTVLVTVDLEPGLTPENFQPITEQTIRKKSREDAKELIGRGLKGAVKESYTKLLVTIGCGVGIGWILCTLLGGGL